MLEKMFGCTLVTKLRAILLMEADFNASNKIILSGGSAPDIREQAERENVWDLRRAGLRKVSAGVTSLEEVNRVTVD